MNIRKVKIRIVAYALVAVFSTALLPVTPAYAASITDLLAPTTSQGSSGGSGIVDILIGLLLGKLVGDVSGNNTENTAANTISKVLGWSNTTGQSSASTTAASVINTAKQYMGVPYVWGGVTTSGFDCSGFTQYVMKQNGITIPRTAAEQYKSGVSILKSNLKVGDLVFFTTYKPGASHVGFYMGDGKFIHASSGAEQVTISSLDEPYYTEKYIGARRYIQ